ncbi:hypothetical protein CPLU01_08032 [Colletotrichum plurivorum]|uniref:Uncharacterized protein n=1 Tax=Colletotrichum plurivorum TaxID=2175906 RepID=A0A8H6KE37_9PEZI|nr:hypothetical protein CPLU01_08032 [Colletotrichum plurivorum]
MGGRQRGVLMLGDEWASSLTTTDCLGSGSWELGGRHYHHQINKTTSIHSCPDGFKLHHGFGCVSSMLEALPGAHLNRERIWLSRTLISMEGKGLQGATGSPARPAFRPFLHSNVNVETVEWVSHGTGVVVLGATDAAMGKQGGPFHRCIWRRAGKHTHQVALQHVAERTRRHWTDEAAVRSRCGWRRVPDRSSSAEFFFFFQGFRVKRHDTHATALKARHERFNPQ